jgi:hypothetical protein
MGDIGGNNLKMKPTACLSVFSVNKTDSHKSRRYLLIRRCFAGDNLLAKPACCTKK